MDLQDEAREHQAELPPHEASAEGVPAARADFADTSIELLLPDDGQAFAEQPSGPVTQPIQLELQDELLDTAALRSERAGRRRAGQDHRRPAHRHSAVQHLPERSRRTVAPAVHRVVRMGDGVRPSAWRKHGSAGALAGRQLGHRGLRRSVDIGALARTCADALHCHRPCHTGGAAVVQRRRRRDPPPAAPVCRGLPETRVRTADEAAATARTRRCGRHRTGGAGGSGAAGCHHFARGQPTAGARRCRG